MCFAGSVAMVTHVFSRHRRRVWSTPAAVHDFCRVWLSPWRPLHACAVKHLGSSLRWRHNIRDTSARTGHEANGCQKTSVFLFMDVMFYNHTTTTDPRQRKWMSSFCGIMNKNCDSDTCGASTCKLELQCCDLLTISSFTSKGFLHWLSSQDAGASSLSPTRHELLTKILWYDFILSFTLHVLLCLYNVASRYLRTRVQTHRTCVRNGEEVVHKHCIFKRVLSLKELLR